MTPEQIAAEALSKHKCADAWPLGCNTHPCILCQEFGISAVERMSAAGLVLLTAERAAALLEIERRAQQTQSEIIEGTHA